MPNISSKALSIALQGRGRHSVVQAPGCVHEAYRRCGEQQRLLTIGERLGARNMSQSCVGGARTLLGKEDRTAGFGMRSIHTGKEVEDIEEKGAEEKGPEETGAKESGAGEKHNNVIDDASSPTIRRTWGTHSQNVIKEAAKLARKERARQNADPDAPGNKRQPTPAALLAAITRTSNLPYAIGTDLCYIPRIQRILSEQLLKTESAPKFWFRVLTPVESSVSGWKNMKTVQRRTEFLAGRWAAKEAVMKAWESAYPGRKKLFMEDIVILSPKQCKLIALAESTAGAPAVAEEVPIVADKEPALIEEVPIVAEEEPAVAKKVAADINTKNAESSIKTSGPPKAFVRVPGGKPWKEVSISISHDGDFASAVALVTIDSIAARRVFTDATAVRRMVSKNPNLRPEKPMPRTIKLGEGKE